MGVVVGGGGHLTSSLCMRVCPHMRPCKFLSTQEFERIAMRVAERPEPPEWRRERLQRFRSSGNADSSWQSGSGQRGRPREAGDEGGRPRGSSEVQGSWGGDPDAAVALSRLSLDARQVLG